MIVAINQPYSIVAKLDDGATDRFLQARVFNSSGVEVSGSPFNMNHDSLGIYRNSSWTPSVEGYYSISVITYTNVGRTVIDTNYRQSGQSVNVRDIYADVDTLISRLTQQRADNLDNLDATISSRESGADAQDKFNQITDNIDSTEGSVVK